MKTDHDVNDEANVGIDRRRLTPACISIGAHTTKKTIGVEEGEYSKGVIPAVEILRGIGNNSMPNSTTTPLSLLAKKTFTMGRGQNGEASWRIGSKDRLQKKKAGYDCTAKEEIDSAIEKAARW